MYRSHIMQYKVTYECPEQANENIHSENRNIRYTISYNDARKVRPFSSTAITERMIGAVSGQITHVKRSL